MFARNLRSGADAAVAFTDLGGRQTAWTGNRMEFIGRNGSLTDPAGVASMAPLSNTVGGGLDPCGVMQSLVMLPAHGSVEIVCFLGQATDAQAARALVTRYRAADLDAVHVLANMVRIVDRPGGQPAQAGVERFEKSDSIQGLGACGHLPCLAA
jgi:cyclic beta-1,2-glucan synthetase